MVSCPEHDNSMPGAPHDGHCVESRNGNLISGPCLLHQCDEQVLKKAASSSHAESSGYISHQRRNLDDCIISVFGPSVWVQLCKPAMEIPGSFHHSTALQLISVLCVLGVVVPDVGGTAVCPPFTCGHLNNVSSPFRRRGDPSECGVPSYELNCADGKATIQIDNGTYFVTSINYYNYGYYYYYYYYYYNQDDFAHFWAVDANILDSRNNCPLPQWKRTPYYEHSRHELLRNMQVEFDPSSHWWAIFVSCSQEVKNNDMYMPVTCLSTISSFVYVLTSRYSYYIENLEPSCGYLAMTPLGALDNVAPANASLNLSYADVVKFMTKGFSVKFPFIYRRTQSFKKCLMEFIP
ncbi:hypothetical protein ABZP36_024698 [Zizania latifolia]